MHAGAVNTDGVQTDRPVKAQARLAAQARDSRK
jgi:hypothetical protein